MRYEIRFVFDDEQLAFVTKSITLEPPEANVGSDLGSILEVLLSRRFTVGRNVRT